MSGRLVGLDVDPKHGGDVALAELERKYGPLPDTYTVRTGGGGWHYYFILPEGVEVRCSIGEIGPGLDIKGEGGYLVGAGPRFEPLLAFARRERVPGPTGRTAQGVTGGYGSAQ